MAITQEEKDYLGELKQVIIARKDLKMSPGKLAAQVAHASISAVMYAIGVDTETNRIQYPTCLNIYNWWKGSQTKIVLAVKSEEELLKVYQAALDAGLNAALIQDEGRTELGEPTYTTVGIGPHHSVHINPITGELPLYR